MTQQNNKAYKDGFLKHGNMEADISGFDLWTTRGETKELIALPAPQEQPLLETPQPDTETPPDNGSTKTDIPTETDTPTGTTNTGSPNGESGNEPMDESMKKIYETLKAIKDFEEKTRKLRNIKFAKREKVN